MVDLCRRRRGNFGALWSRHVARHHFFLFVSRMIYVRWRGKSNLELFARKVVRSVIQDADSCVQVRTRPFRNGLDAVSRGFPTVYF